MAILNDCDTKIILWDLGNVLIQGVHEPLFDLIYKKSSTFSNRSLFDQEVCEIINESFYGKIDLGQTWKSIQDHANINDSDFAEIQSSVDTNSYNEELICKAQKLNKKYTFGILSDLSQIGYSVVKKNIKHFVDICDPSMIFISTFHGLTKLKDKQSFFKLALEKINHPPSQVLFIDDNQKLVEMAQSLGTKGIVYQRSKKDTSWKAANESLCRDLVKMNIA